MRQFPGSQVFINFNLFTDADKAASIERTRRQYAAELAASPGLRKKIAAERQEAMKKYNGYFEWRLSIKENQNQKKDKRRDEVMPAKTSLEGSKYEKEVHDLMLLIQRSVVGSMLIRSLNPRHKVWVVPSTTEEGGTCDCVAMTSLAPFSADQGGGVRIYYWPIPGVSRDNYYASDDVLFHELVHAYRSGWVSPGNQRSTALTEYKTEEEFLAVHVTNVYRSLRGDIKFYRAHLNSTLMTKDNIYSYLASDKEAFAALEYFQANDSLAKRVAKLTHPAFNPWRDFPEIKKRRDGLIDL